MKKLIFEEVNVIQTDIKFFMMFHLKGFHQLQQKSSLTCSPCTLNYYQLLIHRDS